HLEQSWMWTWLISSVPDFRLKSLSQVLQALEASSTRFLFETFWALFVISLAAEDQLVCLGVQHL
ncbi:hypothetical protein C0993_006173, partial [Termitomyces sp. T159_Od127]